MSNEGEDVGTSVGVDGAGRPCPQCGAVGAIEVISGTFHPVCTSCGYVEEEVSFYELETLSPWLEGVRRVETTRPQPNGAARALRVGDRDRTYARERASITTLIRGTLRRFGRDETLVQRVDAMFDVAPRTRWGRDANATATACIYITLRRDHVPIDLHTVAAAADQPLLKVRRAFHALNPDVPELHPYALLDSLAHQHTPKACRNHVLALARNIASILYPSLSAHIDATAVARALLIVATEGVTKRKLVLRKMRLPPTVLTRYTEIHTAAHEWIKRLPWLPKDARRNDRTRIVMNLADAVRLRTAALLSQPQPQPQPNPPPGRDAEAEAEAEAEHRPKANLLDILNALPPRDMYTQLQAKILSAAPPHPDIHAHPIDRLSNAQVDQILFAPDELESFFRTPDEARAFAHAKVASGIWDEHEHEYDTALDSDAYAEP